MTTTQRPFFYNLFFLYLEPLITVAGTYMAHFRASEYIRLTSHLPISPPSPPAIPPSPSGETQTVIVPPTTQIILSQLANMYLFVAIIESTVLRSTNDIKVWRAVIVGLLVADLGHILSVYVKDHHEQQRQLGTGWGIYYRINEWNEMDWGNLGFVYFAAMVRVMFLLGVGLGGGGSSSSNRNNSDNVHNGSRQVDKKEI